MVLVTGATQAKVADPAVTAMANGPTDAVLVPLLAVMVIPLDVPTLTIDGVPVNAPVVALKFAQPGLFATENVIAVLLADGVG